MSLSEQKKETMRRATARAAKALVEDLEHVREILARRTTSRAEIRRLSNVIRRILVEGDLTAVAAPRIGRLTIMAPDNSSFYEVEHDQILFFASGGAKVFGLGLGGLMIRRKRATQVRPLDTNESEPRPLPQKVPVRLDNFLSQRVLCYMGFWATRREAIKYVANYGSGVHSQNAHPNNLMEWIRASCTYKVERGKLVVTILPELGENCFSLEQNWRGRKKNFLPVDILLVEVLAAGALVASSPDVHELERIIARE